MSDIMCPDCHWPIDNAKHSDVHPRMLRYYYTVDGVPFESVRPWDAWSQEWQKWFTGLVAAQQQKMAAGQVITMIHVTNYSPAEEAIRWWIEIDLG